MLKRIEDIIKKTIDKALKQKKDDYDPFLFIKIEADKCSEKCKELYSKIQVASIQRNTESLIYRMTEAVRGEPLGEELKVEVYMEVPDEIYETEFIMVGIPYQILDSVQKLQNKI